jgi:hypothetical protein
MRMEVKTMANRAEVTEEQIIRVLRNPQYTSERQRCIALGIVPSGSQIKKFNTLRKRYGIPDPEPGKRGKAMSINTIAPAPAPLKFDDIQKDNRLMWRKKRLIVILKTDEEIRFRRMDGSEYKLSRKQFEETAAEYTLVPPGDPQGGPVKTYIDHSLKVGKAVDAVFGTAEITHKTDKKPATINPNLEECFKPAPELTPEERAELEEIAEALKAEMITEDKVKEVFGITEEVQLPKAEIPEPFKDEDYVDSEWGAAEKEISDTVLRRREYLDKIDQLLDLMMPVCRLNPLLKVDVKNLAKSIMETGFNEEFRKDAGA